MYKTLKNRVKYWCLPLACAGLISCSQPEKIQSTSIDNLEGMVCGFGVDPCFPESTYYIHVKTKDGWYEINVRDADNPLAVRQLAKQLKLRDIVKFPTLKDFTNNDSYNICTLKPVNITIIEHNGSLGALLD